MRGEQVIVLEQPTDHTRIDFIGHLLRARVLQLGLPMLVEVLAEPNVNKLRGWLHQCGLSPFGPILLLKERLLKECIVSIRE